jgi:uncharacterized phage-like protein YoqJ
MSLLSSCAFTGHRPQHFGFGYNGDDEKCVKLKAVLREQIEKLIAGGVTDFYSGMALGVDEWAAEIVLSIKKEYPCIRLTAVRPCETQADAWTAEQRERHYNALTECDSVVTLQSKYTRSCMFERNRYLVDHAEHLLAVYDGGSKGGTAYTVRYARQKERRITIISPDTLDVILSQNEGSGKY